MDILLQALLYNQSIHFMTNPYEEHEDTKGVIRNRSQRRADNTMAKRKGPKLQKMIYKTLLRKLKLKHCEIHK